MDFVTKYQNYQHVKYEHQKPSVIFQQMPITKLKWEIIIKDLFIGLRKTLRMCDSIQVIIDQLTKSTHFILVRVEYNASKLEKIYMKEIMRHYGVPVFFIVSNKGTQFSSNFWDNFLSKFGTRLDLSTTFQQQTDGQSEQIMQVLKYIF